MTTAQTVKQARATNANRALARAPRETRTLQEIEAEKRLLLKDQEQEDRDELLAYERRYLNADGDVLQYEIRIPKTETKKTSVNGNVNHHKYAIPRGVKSVVPWYIAKFFSTNTEILSEPSVDEKTGRATVVASEVHPVTMDYCAPINPAPESELPF